MLFFYVADSASKGTTLTFKDGDRITDQDGKEWVIDNVQQIHFNKNKLGWFNSNISSYSYPLLQQLNIQLLCQIQMVQNLKQEEICLIC